jgi:very-short-patch-repair endonuclease
MRRPTSPVPRLPDSVPAVFLSRGALRAQGVGSRELTVAVRDGILLRPRRGRYLPAPCHPVALGAAGAGGRVDCVSLLALLGVFVEDSPVLHVQIAPDATRLPRHAWRIRRHWRATSAEPDAVIVPLIEALAQSVRCQPPRAAIATLDSAWHLRLVDEVGIAQVFALLPRRYRRLRALLDRRAESGTESFVRLMLRGLGCRFDLQAEIPGVGFVDLLVEGWLIIECDSAEHHSEWRSRKRDIRRDAVAASLGYVTVRLLAEDILFHPEQVVATLRAVLDRWNTPPPAHNPGRPAHSRRAASATRRPSAQRPEL